MNFRRDFLLRSLQLAITIDLVLLTITLPIISLIGPSGNQITVIDGIVFWVILSWFPTIAFVYTWLQMQEISQKQSEFEHDLVSTQRDLKRSRLNARSMILQLWLSEVSEPDYVSELDVEFKFVYPLLRWLGFDHSDLRPRISITLQVGRRDIRGEADWVVYRDSKPYIIVEAKAVTLLLRKGSAFLFENRRLVQRWAVSNRPNSTLPSKIIDQPQIAFELAIRLV